MKLNTLITLGLATLGTLSSLAVPARPGDRQLIQPDGTVLTARLIGDENFHAYVTPDGKYLTRDESGFWVATSERTSSAPARARRAAPRRVGETQVPNNGSPRVPILLVEYKDKKFKDADPKATFEKFFSDGDTSARRYFEDQSNGKYTPEFDVYGPYTLSSNRSVYGGNDSEGYDKGVGKMVAEGALGLDSQVDFSLYDNDGDGECDVLIVLYAGDGEASSYDSDAENSVWPCQWELSASEYGRALTLDKTRVDKFAVFNELNGSNLRKIDGIGTFCHEFSHCLGLPDFYDTKYRYFGMGSWSLMDYGSYNNDSYTPIGYSAYEKRFMGWIEIEEGKQHTLYTLPALNSGSEETDRAVMLTNPADENEYFILENRRKQGWDEYMPAEGLFIYHVTFSQSAWDTNTVNDYAMQRMTPVPADNSLKLTSGRVDIENEKGDLWPYAGNNAFTDDSTPAAKVNTGKYLGKPVTEITSNADGTVSFWVMKGMLPKLPAPEGLCHDFVSSDAVTFNWNEVEDADCHYSLEVREYVPSSEREVLSTVFDNDSHGWECTGYTIVENGGIRLGSAKQLGTILSPAFEGTDNGVLKVTLNAHYYSGDQSDLKVSVLDASGNELQSETVSLTAQYADHSLTFSGIPEGNLQIAITTLANKKRAYVASVTVTAGGQALTRSLSDDGYLLIERIEGAGHQLEGLKEDGKYICRIKAVPREEGEYLESDWSAPYTLDMTEYLTTGIEGIGTVGDAAEEWFSIQGVALGSRPTLPGIYICRKGKTTVKVRI